MGYRELSIEELVNAVETLLPNDFNVIVEETTISDGIRRTPIRIGKGDTISSTRCAEHFIAEYEHGASISSVARRLIEEITAEVELQNISSSEVLSKCYFRMANKVFTKPYAPLGNVPVKEIPGITDIVLYPVYEMSENLYLTVTNKGIETVGLTVPEVFKAAEDNTEKRVQIISLMDRLRETHAIPESEDTPMMVSDDTNRERGTDNETGISILGAPEYLKQRFEGSGAYYILPSSVYELLFLPKGLTNLSDLLDLVHQVNQTLKPGEWLSDNVYELTTEGKFITHEAQKQTEM